MQVIMLKTVIFICLFAMFYFLSSYLKNNSAIQKSVAGMYKKALAGIENRRQQEVFIRQQEGAQEDSFLHKLDKLIINSNIRKFFPFINTEIYILITTVTAGLGFFLMNFVSGNWILGLVTMLASFLIFYFVVYIMAGVNYKKTEDNIVTFTNLLENYSKTNDDLIAIFGKIFPYLDEPLKTAVEDCYYEAVQSGNRILALNNLTEKIEHEKFKEIIRNLEVCSRHEANYAEIITDSRHMLREYIANKEERKSAIQTGRIEVAVILISCLVIINLLNSFLQGSILAMLTSDLIGKAILVYCIVIIFISIYKLLSFDKGE